MLAALGRFTQPQQREEGRDDTGEGRPVVRLG